MTHDSLTTYDQPLGGNSPASKDIAFHMHPYTNPAVPVSYTHLRAHET